MSASSTSDSQIPDNVPLVFVGDIKGDVDKAFSKLKKVASTMSPSVGEVSTFLLGDVFSDLTLANNPYLKGEKSAPIHMYVLGPINEKQFANYPSFFHVEEEQHPSNLTYLGDCGVISLTKKLIVAYMGGVESDISTPWSFNKKTIQRLMKKCKPYEKIDILISYQWPRDIEKSIPSSTIQTKNTSRMVGELVMALQPRLHIAVNEQTSFVSPVMSHEYENPLANCTSFIGLSDFSKYRSEKWVYGVRFPVIESSKPEPTINIPFTYTGKDPRDPGNFFFSSSSSKRKDPGNSRPMKKKRAPTIVSPSTCWFCLGNPNVDRSLILSIADHMYLSMDKGPIVENHVAIVPITHINSMIEATTQMELETHRFLQSLEKYFESMNKKLVWFERSYKTPHLQINCIPVDAEHLQPLANHTIMMAEKQGVEAERVRMNSIMDLHNFATGSNYFYVQIGEADGVMVDITIEDFPLNFGRMLIAQVLGVPDRVIWHKCVNSEEIVTKSVNTFKNEFKTFDFTLESDGE